MISTALSRGSIWTRMKKRIQTTCLSLVLLLMLWPARFSQCAAATNELRFPVGEKLTYKLYWGIIRVGTSHLSSEWVEEDGKRYIFLRATARTAAIVAAIYPVDDCIESLVDPDTFLPVRYTQKLKEGRHIRDDRITFDHKACKAFWTSGLTNTTRYIDIGPDTRDVLTLTYYMRPVSAEAGDKSEFRVLVDDKLYDLELTILDLDDMKLSGFGRVDCIKVEPKARFGGIFTRKGKVTAWFSNDEHRILTMMVAKLPVANLHAVLSEVEGWGDGKWGGDEVRAEAGESDGTE
jgi:hypothetical protein